MSDQYEKGIFIIDYLESIGLDAITIGDAICDEHYEKSYDLIRKNPQISQEEFLSQMGIEEYVPCELGSIFKADEDTEFVFLGKDEDGTKFCLKQSKEETTQEMNVGEFISACLSYNTEKIVSMMKQGYDVCGICGENGDFLYNVVLEEFLYGDFSEDNVSTEQKNKSLLPKLTKLFCENGADFAKLDKYVNDGNHPTPFWMLAFLKFDENFRKTIEVLVEHGMTVNEYEEIIDHITTDLCFCYNEGYGLPNTPEFDINMQAIMWFTSFPQMFDNAEWYKKYMGYREGFDYTQFRIVDNFTYKTENFDTSNPFGPAHSKVEVFDLAGNKVYEFTLA